MSLDRWLSDTLLVSELYKKNYSQSQFKKWFVRPDRNNRHPTTTKILSLSLVTDKQVIVPSSLLLCKRLSSTSKVKPFVSLIVNRRKFSSRVSIYGYVPSSRFVSRRNSKSVNVTLRTWRMNIRLRLSNM